jgi:hypothetical protein
VTIAASPFATDVLSTGQPRQFKAPVRALAHNFVATGDPNYVSAFDELCWSMQSTFSADRVATASSDGRTEIAGELFTNKNDLQALHRNRANAVVMASERKSMLAAAPAVGNSRSLPLALERLIYDPMTAATVSALAAEAGGHTETSQPPRSLATAARRPTLRTSVTVQAGESGLNVHALVGELGPVPNRSLRADIEDLLRRYGWVAADICIVPIVRGA